MRRSVGSMLLAVLTAGLASLAWCVRPSSVADPKPRVIVCGSVSTSDGPVAGAVVRVQATENATLSGPDGGFALRVASGGPVTVTAWCKGHYIGWRQVTPGSGPVEIVLRPHYTEDDEEYLWFSAEAVDGSKSCGHCMPGHYAEWKDDAHGLSAVNPRFLSMYNGTDTQGNRTTMIRPSRKPDYGGPPARPDPNRPYYGPGYKLDFPDEAGNCAACHAPIAAASVDAEVPGDINDLTAVEKEGVSCEFCHKIGEVTLDASTGLPYWHMPGVESIRLYRPPQGRQLFFGTFDDVTRRVTYSPLLKESAFCAPCHWGMFSGLLVYNSFGEWLDSPYSDPDKGRTCQHCHMPATKDTHFALREKGGLRRKPGRIFNHRMPGASDVAFLRDTAKLEIEARRRPGRIVVGVRVTNEKAGHHIPTGHPGRNILLVVSATDAQGRELEHLGKQVLPDWAGIGEEGDDYAGKPGKGFAKILEELWTGTHPTVAYWRHASLREDTRIEATATDRTRYEFAAAADSAPVTVRAKLIYRRAFKALARQKKWDVRDILMEQEEVVVP